MHQHQHPHQSPAATMPPARLEKLRHEMARAQERHLAGGIARTLKVHLPIVLIEEAKARTGITDDEEVLRAALIHLVMGD